MKVLKVLSIVVVLLAVVGLCLPSTTHVERSTVIKAPQERVFEYVNNFQHFNQWSPWAAKDPNTRYQYSGPESGVGSKMAWQSDSDQVGSGSQEIIKSEPYNYVETTLDFGAQGTANANYRITSTGELTSITWSFDTDHGWNLLSRGFGLMMDGMLGPDYETGLANLKRVVEGQESLKGNTP
ncbi:SRPBCC family protein [bacterium SCSIO 12696]|nr:SRPBCC family protein [bacterium SCSIO 12696]